MRIEKPRRSRRGDATEDALGLCLVVLGSLGQSCVVQLTQHLFDLGSQEYAATD